MIVNQPECLLERRVGLSDVRSVACVCVAENIVRRATVKTSAQEILKSVLGMRRNSRWIEVGY